MIAMALQRTTRRTRGSGAGTPSSSAPPSTLRSRCTCECRRRHFLGACSSGGHGGAATRWPGPPSALCGCAAPVRPHATPCAAGGLLRAVASCGLLWRSCLLDATYAPTQAHTHTCAWDFLLAIAVLLYAWPTPHAMCAGTARPPPSLAMPVPCQCLLII